MRHIVNKNNKISKKTVTIVSIAAAVVAIVVIALSSYLSAKNYDKTDIGNTHSNIANRSCVVQSENRFFFADDKIYVVDESNNTSVFVDYEATDLLVHDGYLYYVNYDDNQYIYRTSLDSKESELVAAVSGGYINIVGDTLYYASLYGTSYSGIYRVDLNNINPEKPEVVTIDWASNLLYYNERLYFINEADGSRLYSMKLDGSDRAVSAERATTCFAFYEGMLYYSNVFGVFKCKPDGSNLVQLSDIRSTKINVANGYIYHSFYASQSDDYDQATYRMNLDGSNEIKLTNDSASYITYVDGFIYFKNVFKSYDIYRISEDNSVFENVLKLYGVE